MDGGLSSDDDMASDELNDKENVEEVQTRTDVVSEVGLQAVRYYTAGGGYSEPKSCSTAWATMEHPPRRPVLAFLLLKHQIRATYAVTMTRRGRRKRRRLKSCTKRSFSMRSIELLLYGAPCWPV